MSGPVQCRGCNRTIVFERGKNGKAIPLERVRTVYFIDINGALQEAPVPAGGFYISHFITCPKASEFSKGQ